ncbi:TcaA second domain-containing protein [Halobacillus sp. B23F22_1]|uniref:TcaA second domain-containing protein n=1 Tax=Halobacillus sp. B23F22_1 TaxID=3459514 RepID=UPI00373F50B4
MGECQSCGNNTVRSQRYCNDCQSNQNVKQPADFARSDEWLNASRYYEEYQDEQNSHKKRNWRKIFASIITVLLLLGFAATGWAYLNKVTSAKHTVQEFEKAVKNSDAERLVQLISFEHTSTGFNKSQAEHMIHYFKESPGEFLALIGYLRASADGAEEDESQNMHVNRLGTKWLLFDQYKIKLDPAGINIQTSQENVNLYLNGDEVGELSEGIYELKGVTPGEHVVKGEVEVKGDRYDHIMSVNTYENKDNPIEIEFEELSPEVLQASLEKRLEDDIKTAVENHVNEYVEAYEDKDINAFQVMKNDSYLQDTEANIQEMDELGKNFSGEIKSITYDIGSLELERDETSDLFTSSIIVSFVLDAGYYLEGDDPDHMLSNENTYSWNYEFAFEEEEKSWVITSGTPMAMFETDELEVKEFE